MVVLDNSIFCLTLHPNAKPRKAVDRAHDRVKHLIDTLRDAKEVAIIPAPVLAEFLVFAGTDAPEYLVRIRESSVMRVEPFDERAAIELADIEITARKKGNKRGSAVEAEWQKIKVDRQIVAVARVHGASVIYSDDPDILAHGNDCGVKVLTLADLSLPPSQQNDLFSEVLSEAQGTENEIAEPEPAEFRGSGDGSPQDKASAETHEDKSKEEKA